MIKVIIMIIKVIKCEQNNENPFPELMFKNSYSKEIFQRYHFCRF